MHGQGLIEYLCARRPGGSGEGVPSIPAKAHSPPSAQEQETSEWETTTVAEPLSPSIDGVQSPALVPLLPSTQDVNPPAWMEPCQLLPPPTLTENTNVDAQTSVPHDISTPTHAVTTTTSQLPDHPPAPSSCSSGPLRRKPKEEGLFARGFLNKVPKKRVGTGDASTVATPGPLPGKQAPNQVKGLSPADSEADATSFATRTVEREQAAGVTAFHTCRYREAKDAFQRMLEAAKGAGLAREEGQAYRLMANALDKLDAPDQEIEEAFKKALAIAHQQDDMRLSFDVLTGMASHAVKAGDLDLGEHLYLQCHALATRVLSAKEVAVAEANLAMCLGQMESRGTESLAHFRRAIALQEQQPDANPHNLAALRANFASALHNQGRQEESEEQFSAALALARAAGDIRVQTGILINLANLADDQGQPQKARQYREALSSLRGGSSQQREGSQPAECAVCLEALEGDVPQPVVVLGCRHAYHRACWDGYLQNGVGDEGRCPQCRNPLRFCATAA